ncbi:MAG: sulfatase family protein [Bryobacteraceae bacterium]
MNRRAFLLSVSAGLPAAGAQAPPRASERRPNIIFIQTDDQAPWALGLSGNEQARTPNLDTLFKQGAYLKNSFTVTPVCSPSRASLMTSRYGSELGITDWINPRVEPELGLSPDVLTWSKALASAGYSNGLVGKWHLGTQDRYHPRVFGFQHFAGFRAGGTTPKDPELEIDGKVQRVPGFEPDVLTDEAIEFVRDNSGKSFLLSLQYRSPHAPWLPVAEEDWAKFKDMEPKIPNPDYPNLDTERARKMMREYLASVSGVDRNVGRLLKELDRLKLSDNTVVIFTSDHGYNMAHNGIWHKGNGHWLTTDMRGLKGSDPRVARPNMYDNSIRVPTAVKWPGVIRPGTVISQTVSNLDWFPTLLAMAQVKVPENAGIYGRNLIPLLKGARTAWNNDLYGEYSQHHYVQADLRMFRTPEWKLVRDFRNKGKDELYHLAKDPAENHNLISEPSAQQIRSKLDSALLARMRSLKDPLAAA